MTMGHAARGAHEKQYLFCQFPSLLDMAKKGAHVDDYIRLHRTTLWPSETTEYQPLYQEIRRMGQRAGCRGAGVTGSNTSSCTKNRCQKLEAQSTGLARVSPLPRPTSPNGTAKLIGIIRFGVQPLDKQGIFLSGVVASSSL